MPLITIRTTDGIKVFNRYDIHLFTIQLQTTKPSPRWYIETEHDTTRRLDLTRWWERYAAAEHYCRVLGLEYSLDEVSE